MPPRRGSWLQEMPGEALQHTTRDGPIAIRNSAKCLGDGRLDGASGAPIGTLSLRGQAEHGAAAIPLGLDPDQEPLHDEAFEHSGQRAGVNVQNRRKFLCRDAWEKPHHPQYQPLRAGNADDGVHALGRCREAVGDRPQQLHELQNGRQF